MNNNQNDGNEYEKYCYVCRRSESKAGPMIMMPGGISICHDCMQKSFDAAMQMTGGDFSQFMNPNMNGMPNLNGMPNFFGMPGGFPGMNGTQNTGNGQNTGNIGNGQNAGNSQNSGNTGNGTADDKTEQNDENNAVVLEGSVDDGDDDQNEKEEQGNGFNPNDMFGNMGFSMVMSPEDLQQLFRGRNPKGVKKKKEELPKIDMKTIPFPHEIYAMLSEFVVGQETAKKAISVGVYNHYKRIANEDKDVEIEKSNMLLIGPTGCGKTFLVKTLAHLLDVPLAIADATALTEAGYIGDDIESVVTKLLAAADNDVARAERGIIFIDEIDKLARKRNATQRDVSGESVQQGLLKLLEGAEVEVPVGANSKNAMVPLETVNTKNILFICGGAFPDLDEIIRERLNEKSSMGFGADLKDKYNNEKDILKYVETEDIRKFGMIPEFIGRMPVITTLTPMDKEMLIRVLKEPKNAIIKQYKKLLEMDEVELRFSNEAYEEIAERALKRDTGARALRSIIEGFMLDIMFEIPKDPNIGRVTITREYIQGKGGPRIEMRSQLLEEE